MCANPKYIIKPPKPSPTKGSERRLGLGLALQSYSEFYDSKERIDSRPCVLLAHVVHARNKPFAALGTLDAV
jgi:hypothetical protein